MRQAIADANASNSADVIVFSVSGQIDLTTGDLIITDDLTIDGDSNTDGAPDIVISGGLISRVFQVSSGAKATLKNLTVTEGTGTSQGGGILNFGDLTLDAVLVTGNVENSLGPANFQFGGGGIYNGDGATLLLRNSTVSDNLSLNHSGGGIYSFFNSDTFIENSTISGNVGGDVAGGLRSLGDVNVLNSTFSGNTSTAWHGGAIFHTDGVLNITSSLITGNMSAPDTANGLMLATFGAPTTANLYNTRFEETGQACQVEGGAAAVLNADAGTVFSDSSCSPNLIPTVPVAIHKIQADGDISPFVGQLVTVEAVVIGDFQDVSGTNGDRNGFFLQEEDADVDADPLTSEGIFVFDGSNPSVDVAPGDLVRVTGTAGEFFNRTQISNVQSVVVVSSGNPLPTPAVLDLPATAEQREAIEGMLVTVPDEVFITEYFNYDRFGEIVVSVADPTTDQPGTDGRLDQFTQFNTPDATGFAAYQDAIADRRLVIDDGRLIQNPPPLLPDGSTYSETNSFRGGDTLQNVTGVLDFAFGEFRLQPIATAAQPNTITSQNPRPTSPDDVGGSLKVATLNVQNFFTTLDESGNSGSGPNALDPRGADNQAEFDRQLDKLLETLNGMDADIVGLVELENEFGGDQNGDGKFAIDSLVAAYNTE